MKSNVETTRIYTHETPITLPKKAQRWRPRGGCSPIPVFVQMVAVCNPVVVVVAAVSFGSWALVVYGAVVVQIRHRQHHSPRTTGELVSSQITAGTSQAGNSLNPRKQEILGHVCPEYTLTDLWKVGRSHWYEFCFILFMCRPVLSTSSMTFVP